ncbi:MAG: HAD-IA family hydrolase [Burkholderiales bacterium]
MTTQDITFDALVDRYELFLFDAYGVLVHGTGIMPGAIDAIARLRQRGRRFYVVTNDASKLPSTAAKRYAAMGLHLEPECFVTSGMLLAPYFTEHRLVGTRCAVLGPRDGIRYVEQAGGVVVPADTDFDVLVICDETGFPFLETMDAALTRAIHLIDAGRVPRFIVPNPDIVYPDGTAAFGFAAGSVALMFEAAFARRYPGRTDLRFVRLGKPEPRLYRHALALAGPARTVFVGDQLETDILGAKSAGVDSALLTTGVSLAQLGDVPAELRPTYRLASLAA